MREMLRNAGHMNARNGGLLPLSVVLFSVLAFVTSILFVVSVPTYADSVQAPESDAGNMDAVQSSPMDSSEEEMTSEDEDMTAPSSTTPKDLPHQDSAEKSGARAQDPSVPDNTSDKASPKARQNRAPAPSPFRSARAVNADACLKGDVFTVSHSGRIYKVDRNGRRSFVVDVPNPEPYWTSEGVNALGVGRDAEVIYAIRHWSDPYGQRKYVILRYTVSTGRWDEVTNINETPTSQIFVAGAVQLSTNDYYIGAFDTRKYQGNKVFFNLWKYSPSRNDFIGLGWFDTGQRLQSNTIQGFAAVANGDMAFDDKGNLFVVRGGNRTADLYSISAEELRREEDTLRQVQKAGSVPTIEAINGIAFDADGRLFLGDASSMRAHDPIDLEFLGNRSTSLDASQDLAACESPATIMLRKNIVDRVAESDQFTLNMSLYKNDVERKRIPSVTTEGNAVGLQKENVGVFPVKTGSHFVFSEEMAAGSASSLNKYAAAWRCTADGRELASGPGSSGRVQIPTRPSVKVECTITNTPRNASLVWEKVDGDDRNVRLGGSVWTLDGPLTSGRSQTVRDCVAANAGQCGAGDNDTDPRPGYFKVDGLYLGQYTLRETTPPTGYEGTTQTFTQTLTADKQQRSFGKIDNKKLVAQIEVKKEVLDPAGVKVADASGWTLAVDLESHLHGTLSPLKDSDPWFGKHQVSNASGTVPELWTVSFPNSATRQDVRITEAAKPASYSASIRCTSNKRQPVEGTGSGLNVRSLQPGEKLTCVVTNKQLPGAAVWEKTDASGTYLSGSEWSVTTTQQGVINVQDCVKAGACQNGGDRDPQPGRFRLEGLKWQNLSLEETAAPPGYRRDTAVRTQTIGENALQANFGRITNETVTLPLLPLTGGMGADSFLMAGAGILTLAFGAAAMRRLHPAGNNSLATQSLYGEMTERG